MLRTSRAGVATSSAGTLRPGRPAASSAERAESAVSNEDEGQASAPTGQQPTASDSPEAGPETEAEGATESKPTAARKIRVQDLRLPEPPEEAPPRLLEELPLWLTPGQARVLLTLDDP